MSALAVPARLAGTEAEGVFTGYASRFGLVDMTGDAVQPGAFRRSLERRGAGGVKLLYQHDPATPLGRWLQIEEDGAGLKVTGALHLDLAKAREVLSLMRSGIVDGLSIGFRTVKARTDPRSGVRKVAEVDLWEISVVTFPMLPAARVTAVAPPPAGLAGSLRAAAESLRR